MNLIVLLLGLAWAARLEAQGSTDLTNSTNASLGTDAPVSTTDTPTNTTTTTSTDAPTAPAPIIKADKIKNNWNETIVQRKNVNLTAFYGSKGDNLTLSCEAPFPIQWNISGRITPEVVEIGHPKKNWSDGTRVLELNLLFSSVENVTGLSAVVTVACEEVGLWQNRDEVAIFVKGPTGKTLVRGGNDKENKVLRCWASDPNTGAPKLVKVGGNEEKVTWDPLEGFSHQDGTPFTPGTYQCRGNNSEILKFDIFGGKYFPEEKVVQVWRDETFDLTCGGILQNRPIRMKTDKVGRMDMRVLTEGEYLIIRRMKANNSGDDLIEGIVTCKEEWNKTESLIHQWSYELLPPPQLYLDNLADEAVCTSGVHPRTVDTLRCKNAMDCDFLTKQCITKNGTGMCKWRTQTVFHSDYETQCWLPGKNSSEGCATLPFSHPHGLIQCGVRGKVRRWTFFTGLDDKKYFNWEAAPKNALVRVEEDETGTLTCTAASFIFASGLGLEIEYQNKSMATTVYPEADKTAIPGLQVKVTLGPWPPEVAAVTCLASVWNSTDIVRKRLARRMEPKAEQRCATPHPKVELRTVVEECQNFFIGYKDKSLNCTSEEEQQDSDGGNTTWFYRKEGEQKERNVTEVFPHFEVKGRLLMLPEVIQDHEGHYTCRVGTSPAGEDRPLRAFKLTVSEEPSHLVEDILLGVAVVVIIILVSWLLYLYRCKIYTGCLSCVVNVTRRVEACFIR